MTWLNATPLAVVNAHAEMLDRLQAAEALLGSAVIAVGTRSIKGHRARQYLNRWERVARPRRGAAKQATPAELKAMGIGQRAARHSDG